MKKFTENIATEIKVVIRREDAIPGKVFQELEVLKPAEVGIGYHGSYKLQNVKIKQVISNFNACGPGSLRVSRVIVKELS